MSDTRTHRISRFLAEQASASIDPGTMLAGLLDELRAIDVPIKRMSCHVQTLHPVFRAVLGIVEAGRDPVVKRLPLASARHRNHLESPLRWVRDHRRGLDVHLRGPNAEGFSVFEELHRDGYTHYIAKPLAFSDGVVNVVTWVSDHPEGFCRSDLVLFEAVAPFLRVALELTTLGMLLRETVSAYVGSVPAKRILAGGMHRGDAFLLRAPMLLVDLVGSTALMAGAAPAQAVSTLNRFFDAVITPIRKRDGEVVKFIGDAVLATFAPRDKAVEDACRRAWAAANAALAAVREMAGAGSIDHPLQARAALHYGEMWYGNVGSGDRLDFTIVGREVNLLFRIGQLGGRLGMQLLMSEAFAHIGVAPATSVGAYGLKGFEHCQRIYSPCCDAG